MLPTDIGTVCHKEFWTLNVFSKSYLKHQPTPAMNLGHAFL